MTPEDFAALAAQDYNRIPVSIEVLADLETPISSYRKLAEGPYSYFFESVHGGEKWGRFSIIGLPPMGGVWGKWYLGMGALDADGLPYLITLLISSLLSIGYLMPIVGRAYFRKPSVHDVEHAHEPSWMCVLPLSLTAIGCIILFISPNVFVNLLTLLFEVK